MLAINTQVSAQVSPRHKHSPKLVSESAGSVHYSQAAPDSPNPESEPFRFGLGFSTLQNVIPQRTGTLTGIFNFNSLDALQLFLAIPQTSPAFNLGGAVFYKRTIAESQNAGFHLGGGVGLADVSQSGVTGANFGMNFTVLAGFHFQLPSIPHIVVHLDGGPSFSFYNTSPTSKTNFTLTPLSPALGLSILYFF